MSFVVTQNCINCKYTDCVEVCPVDCFYEGPNMLVINTDECIDCGLCEPACPISAIVSEDELGAEEYDTVMELNQRYAQKWPQITKKKSALPEAEQWSKIKDKLYLIEE